MSLSFGLTPGDSDFGYDGSSAEMPGVEHLRHDDYGRPMYRFALSYEMDGKDWCAEVWAYSFEDAENRVAAMSRTLTVQGQVHCEIAG